MAKSYWSTFSGQRLSRRRALAAGGALGGSAAILAACGGSDSDSKASSGAQQASGLLASPVDTSDEAKRGGVRKTYLTTDPTTFDVHIFQITAQSFVWAVGSLLFTLVPGKLEPPKLAVQGDVAQSYAAIAGQADVDGEDASTGEVETDRRQLEGHRAGQRRRADRTRSETMPWEFR